MKAYMYPYKPGSESAKLVCKGLGIKRISHRNSTFKGSDDKFVINWGASKLTEEVMKCRVFNSAKAVELASNKLLTFEALAEEFEDSRECNIPEYTRSTGFAAKLLQAGRTIVERHTLNGNSGEGIRIVEPGQDLMMAPLYVVYVPKKQEYRVHICGGDVVDIQRKARRKDVPDDKINWRVRNHANGFVFARGEECGDVPVNVVTAAERAVRCLGLDFGAVDVIYNEKRGCAYVLEVNTAPGLEGTTLQGYIERFGYLVGKEVVRPFLDIPEALFKVPPPAPWPPRKIQINVEAPLVVAQLRDFLDDGVAF